MQNPTSTILVQTLSATATFFSQDGAEQQTTQYVIRANTAGILAPYKSVTVYARYVTASDYLTVAASVTGPADEGYEIWQARLDFEEMGSSDVEFYVVLELNGVQYTDNDNGAPYALPCTSNSVSGCQFYNGHSSLNWYAQATFGGSAPGVHLAFTLAALGSEQQVTLQYSTDGGQSYTAFPLVLADQYWPAWQPPMDGGGPPVFSPNSNGVTIWTPYGDNGFNPDGDLLPISAEALSIRYYFDYSYVDADKVQQSGVDDNFGHGYELSVVQVQALAAAATFFSEGGAEAETAQFWIYARTAGGTATVTVQARYVADGNWILIPASMISQADSGYEIWFASQVFTAQGSGDLEFAVSMQAGGVDYTDDNLGDNYYLPCTSGSGSGVMYYNGSYALDWISSVDGSRMWTLAYAMQSLGEQQQVILHYAVDGGAYTSVTLQAVAQYFVPWQPGNPVASPNAAGVLLFTPDGSTGPAPSIQLPASASSVSYYFDWSYLTNEGQYSGTDDNYGNQYVVTL